MALDVNTIVAQAGSALAKDVVKMCKADLYGLPCEPSISLGSLMLNYETLSFLACGNHELTDAQVQCLLGKLNKIEDITDADTNFLLQEDGFFLLQENGGKLIIT